MSQCGRSLTLCLQVGRCLGGTALRSQVPGARCMGGRDLHAGRLNSAVRGRLWSSRLLVPSSVSVNSCCGVTPGQLPQTSDEPPLHSAVTCSSMRRSLTRPRCC